MPFGNNFKPHTSIKQMQSEMGVTGEPSGNIDIIGDLVDHITEHFVHKHDGHVTENDCILLVSSSLLGYRLDNKEPSLLLFGAQKGCPEDKANMFYALFKSDREIFECARDAIRRVILENMNDALRNINDAIDSDEDDSLK